MEPKSSLLISRILSEDPSIRDQSLASFASEASLDELLAEADALEKFRSGADNLYHRVRSLFFLSALHRYYIPAKLKSTTGARIQFEGYEHFLQRRFEEAIQNFLGSHKSSGASDAISSALAATYYQLGFQTLADQVRQSVRHVRGNQWMFRMGHVEDHPLAFHPTLLKAGPDRGSYPTLKESASVRMDLSHSGWSDIFFLGMDFPEGARVINTSVNLGVWGRDKETRPPIECFVRVIDEPVLRLVSVDLESVAEITELDEVFDFARDYLGLLKAAVIASGVVPPGLEGSGQSLTLLLEKMVGPGRGIELVSSVNGIPKGSRLAVSTNLLAALIAVLMRATQQTRTLYGQLREDDRRMAAARAILGEWLGGSGGGWQDSGGIWPGIKLIEGTVAGPDDPEFGVSRGRLLPTHRILSGTDISDETLERLQQSLILAHGGMAQNVGPVLEMVTEKYLLRSETEWKARGKALEILDRLLELMKQGDIQSVGKWTTENFFGPIQTIIPWATNDYTEKIVSRCKEKFGEDFWGFWMLGGMAGGGMGFLFKPERKAEAQPWLLETMRSIKQEAEKAAPFAMDPVVYDFTINHEGAVAELIALDSQDVPMPRGYYEIMAPRWLRLNPRDLRPGQRSELERLANASQVRDRLKGMIQSLFHRMTPSGGETETNQARLKKLLNDNGFDPVQHEQIRSDLQSGRIGLAQNRLAANTLIEDVHPEDVRDTINDPPSSETIRLGEDAIRSGQVAVLSLAGGVGSRWTQGAGVVKALNPFCKFKGRHRNFIETHLAKTRKVARKYGAAVPHLFSTSYMTEGPIRDTLQRNSNYGYEGEAVVSSGRSVGLRMIPMVRDLRFAWEETPQMALDEQKQKMRDSVRAALMNWAREQGEGRDYTENESEQCLHPVGHWYEFANLLRNGLLHQIYQSHPDLKYLMLHNIDTLGASVDPGLLGEHIRSEAALSFEVIPRRLEDRGGGLARVDGRPQLVEGLAMPHEEAEFELTYYNSMTTWIDLDQTLRAFHLTREDLGNAEKVAQCVRRMAARMPTYVTLKEVKKRWGHGQEDVFPVTQFEKLWSDMTALQDLKSAFLVTPRLRGQQLKDPAQLDGWFRDGSAAFVEGLCDFEGA